MTSPLGHGFPPQYGVPSAQAPQWPGQPVPYHGEAPPGPPAVIDVGRADSKRFVIGSIVSGAVGLIAIVAGLAGAVEGGIGVAIGAVCVGGVFLLIALLPVIARKKAFRPRRLVIEQPGIRWDDPQGQPWAVRWNELAAVSISRHGALSLGPGTVSDQISGAIVDKVAGERVLVRLDLFPADAGFHQRHPEMAHLWAQDRYRLALGQNAALVPQMDAPLRYFQPMRYRGVQETEGFMGLR